MRSEERRRAILRVLNETDTPVSASALAEQFGVSRQIIVGDIALLRSAGEDILATPRGYVMQKVPGGLVRRIAVRHSARQTEQELIAIVDNGCTVLDVIVEHPAYGEITGALRLSSRYDVAQFLSRITGAAPLSALTEGIHLHTLSCPDEAAFERVLDSLRAQGILLEELSAE